MDDLRRVWILLVAEKSLSTLQEVKGVLIALKRLFTLGKMSKGQLSSISISVGKLSRSIFLLMCWVNTVCSASAISIPYKSHGAFRMSLSPKVADPGANDTDVHMPPYVSSLNRQFNTDICLSRTQFHRAFQSLLLLTADVFPNVVVTTEVWTFEGSLRSRETATSQLAISCFSINSTVCLRTFSKSPSESSWKVTYVAFSVSIRDMQSVRHSDELCIPFVAKSLLSKSLQNTRSMKINFFKETHFCTFSESLQ